MAEIKSFTQNASAANVGLHAGHISSNLSQYEAARTGFFTLIVNDIGDGNTTNSKNLTLSPKAWGQNGSEFENAQQSLALAVTKCNIPHFSLEEKEYKRGNEVIKFAGVPTFDSGEIVVDDMLGLGSKNLLMAWQGLAYNIKTKKGGRMADYKKNCTLCEYTQDYELIRSWTLYGCWIQKLNEEAFDKENDGPRKVTATIVYDRAEMIVADAYL